MSKWRPELLSVLKVYFECLSSWISMFVCFERLMRGYNEMELSDVFTVWRRCQEDSDLPEDFVKYLWCHMDEYGWFWTETGVLCPRKCLPCSLYMLSSTSVSGLGLVLLFFFCYYAMPEWCHINQSIDQSRAVMVRHTPTTDWVQNQDRTELDCGQDYSLVRCGSLKTRYCLYFSPCVE